MDIQKVMAKVANVLTYDADGKGPFAYKATDNGEAVLLLADTKFLLRVPCPELEGRADGMIGFPVPDALSAVDEVNYVLGFTSGGAPVEIHQVKTREDSVKKVYERMLAAATMGTMELTKELDLSDNSALDIAGDTGRLSIRENGIDTGARGESSFRYGFRTSSSCIKGFLTPGARLEVARGNETDCFVRVVCPDGITAFSMGKTIPEEELKEMLEAIPADKSKSKVQTKKETKVTIATSDDTLPVPPGVPADLPPGATGSGDADDATDTPPQKTQEPKTTPEEAIEQLMQLVDMAKTLETAATELRREVALRVKKAKTILSPLLRTGGGASTAMEAENAKLKAALVKFEKVKEALKGI